MKMKRYSKDFRLQAARLVTEQGYSYEQVAQRLGPSAWSVRQWVMKSCQNGELSSTEKTGSTVEEMQQLRKEIRRLRMENEILKKAAAYFAREVTP
jgi:transposase